MRRLALVLALGVGLFAPAAPAAAAAPKLPLQNLKWKQCFSKVPKDLPEAKNLQCAQLTAPLDWRKPKGKKITLAISRLKARSGDPKGVVFTNPGGPGEVGLETPLAFLAAKRDKVLDTMDIIGIDVRGTGFSTQARCRGLNGGAVLDPRNRSKKNVKKLLNASKSVAKACQAGGGKLPSQFVTTAQTVQDLDWIRRNLKDSKGGKVNKINWVGYSAGSWLGAHYAAAFPKSTGRFVLDSVIDYTSTWESLHLNLQDKGFQRRFEQDFAKWAAQHDDKFGLGGSAKAVVASYERIRKVIARSGRIRLVVEGEMISIYPSDVDSFLADNLYSKYMFQDAASYLSFLSVITGVGADARAKGAALPAGFNRYAGSTPTLVNIACNDTAAKIKPGKAAAASAKVGKKYPLTGYDNVLYPCQNWKRAKQQLKLKRPGANLPPMLLVQSKNDPATPYEGAVRAHKASKKSSLVTVVNEGDHAIYAGDNDCVNDAVEKYLLEGVMPGKNVTCQGVPAPAPQDGGERAPERAANPLQLLLKLNLR